MTVRTYLAGSIITFLLTGSIWLLILFNLDPDQAGWIGFVLFFLTLFLAAAALAGLLGYFLRRLLTPRQLPARAVRPALRQGLILSLFLNLILFLQLFRLYRWWITIIAIILLLSIEVIFLGHDRVTSKSRPTQK